MTKLALVKKEDPELGKPLPLKYSSIVRFEDNPRKFHLDVESLTPLARSIMSDGQTDPVKVCTTPGQPGVFTLVDGERRYGAFELIWKWTQVEPTVDAYVKVVKDRKQHRRLCIVSNLHRKDFHEVDEARALTMLKEDGHSIEDISDLIGKSTSYVQNYLKVHELPEEVKALMDPRRPNDERLSITSAIDIARSIPVNDPKLRIEIATESVLRQLGVNDVRTLVGERTQNTGYRFGGNLRKPSDDYKVFTSFLGRLAKDSTRFSDVEKIVGMYFHRDDEEGDRKRDAALLKSALIRLQKLVAELEKDPYKK